MIRPRVPALPAALVVAVACELGLRTVSLPRLARWLGVRLDLESGTTAGDDPAVLPWTARPHVYAVDRVLRRWPFGDTCLRRCLVLGNRLRGHGPVLRIGVRRADDGGFTAHSWLELDGRSLDPSSARFGTLAAVPAVVPVPAVPAVVPVPPVASERSVPAVTSVLPVASERSEAEAIPGATRPRATGEDL